MMRVNLNQSITSISVILCTQQIVSSAVVNIGDGAASIIAPIRTIRRCIRRYRQNLGVPHPIPLVSSEMDIPEEFKLTTHGEQFLLFDNGKCSSSRMLIFSTSTNLDLLHRSELWFADGTFKTVPEIFYQLYTIHAFSNGRVFPCVYALLSDKKEETYNTFFLQLNTRSLASILRIFLLILSKQPSMLSD